MRIQKFKKAVLSKQAILGILTVLVITSGIVNWVNNSNQGEDAIETIATQNYSDLDKVIEAEASIDYFTQTVANRAKSRDEAVEILTKSGDIEGVKKIAEEVQQEATIEQLIIATGIEKAVVCINGSNANVVVKANGLTSDQAAQITEIVTENSNVRTRGLVISEMQ